MLHADALAARQPLTQAERVRLQLAAEIVAGEFSPGTRLDEVVQSHRMGVSRTPLREAVRQLAALGLVENRPHRGVVVAAGGDTLCEALAEMEAMCARLACHRMAAGDREELRLLAAADGDWLGALHRGIGNGVLVGLVETLWQPVLEVGSRRGALCPDSRRRLALKAAEAIADGDGDRAQAAMRDLVRAAAGSQVIWPA